MISEIPSSVYALCAVTSSICAVFLLRAFKNKPVRLLFWSAWCFVGLAANNILLFVDLAVIPQIDLSLVRSIISLISISLLLYGLIWEVR